MPEEEYVWLPGKPLRGGASRDEIQALMVSAWQRRNDCGAEERRMLGREALWSASSSSARTRILKCTRAVDSRDQTA